MAEMRKQQAKDLLRQHMKAACQMIADTSSGVFRDLDHRADSRIFTSRPCAGE
ncbi:hypothetical protein [Paracoccus subflavus]|uniref:hypothetical protein n=1 Tax=Paracoccus subflavus TaxID=2528244 RepID=UPI0013EF51A6|nr:hypothetical protein [Paracoccus subflavus]